MAKCRAATLARAQSSEPQWRHGLSLFGDLKYPPGFGYFDYVNPQAPKGGGIRFVALGTFDNFNQAIAGVSQGLVGCGCPATICDTLLVPSLDEASTHYGLIAEAVSYPPSFASTSFRLRAAARHHDGNPITVDDVIYSFEAYKKYNRFIGAFYSHVLRVEQSGEREITFTFDAPGNREMPGSSGNSEYCQSTGGKEMTRRVRSAMSAQPRSSRRSAMGPTASRNSFPAARWFTSV